MVYMAHHCDNRSSRSFITLRLNVFKFFGQLVFYGFILSGNSSVSKLFNYQEGGLLVNNLIDVGHYAQFHQLFDHSTRFNGHALR